MKCGKSVVVALVDLSPVVQQVVKHIELLVSCRKVNGRSSAIVLRQEIRVDRHDVKQTLRISQSDRSVKLRRLMFRHRWVAPGSTHISRHVEASLCLVEAQQAQRYVCNAE